MLNGILLQENNAYQHFDIYENRKIMRIMKTLGDRIDERRKLLGLTQEQLAKRSGINQSQVNRVINGKIKNPPYLYELSKALETSVKWLKTGIEEDISARNENISFNNPDINHKLTNLYVNDLVPVYGNASAGSQGAIKLNEDYVVDQTLRHPGIASVKDSFALYVDGDSMSPRREHGEMIYIHPYKPPEIGKECVIVMEPEGNVLFKRYLGKSKDGLQVLLKQFNPLEEFTVPAKNVRKIYSVIF